MKAFLTSQTKRFCLFLCVAAVLALPGLVLSQPPPVDKRPGDSLKNHRPLLKRIEINKFGGPTRIRIGGNPHDPPQVVQADRLMMDGRYEEAIALLRPLWLADSNNASVVSSLKRAYKGLKDYQGLLRLVEVQWRKDPDNPVLQSEMADTYFLLSEPDSAIAMIEKLLAVTPPEEGRYKLAARTFLRAGRYADGIKIYRRGRKALGDSVAFAEELGRLFEARREYGAAVEEHFRLLQARPQLRNRAQKRIINLIKVPEAASQVTAALERIVARAPDNEFAHSLYGDLLFESGAIDSAFAEYHRADRLSTHPGDNQFRGIKQCLEKREYAAARSQALDFLKEYPDHVKVTDVSFALAQAELGLDHPETAVKMLKTLEGRIPNVSEQARIDYEIGEVYRSVIIDMDSARSYYNRAIARTGRNILRSQALTRLGDIQVYSGQLDAADSTYHAALAAHPRPADRDAIAYRIAEILLFKGQYPACTESLKKLVKENPRGLFVNDALELTMILSENRDAMDWSLNRYAGALYELRRRNPDSALVLFGQLAADSANSLADESLFQIAQIHADRGFLDQAVESYRLLIRRFPESFLVPRAWMGLAKLYEGPLADAGQARDAYQTILTDYRDSPLVEQARLRLQRLSVLQ